MEGEDRRKLLERWGLTAEGAETFEESEESRQARQDARTLAIFDGLRAQLRGEQGARA